MKKYTLPNGLRVVMDTIPASRSVSFGIWIKTGSRDENENNNGISHLIEHMLFKGTKTYSAKAIAEAFDHIGGEVNAFTTKEYTCFYAKVLDEHLPQAIAILADMFFNSLIHPDDLAKEKGVIYEEIAMYEDTPDDIVHDLIAEASFGHHPLGFPIIGKASILSTLGTQDLIDFMTEHYHIHHTVISVAGHVDESAIALISQYFGGFSNKRNEAVYAAPQFLGNQVFQSKKTEQHHLCLALPGYAYRDERRYAMILLNNIIGGGMSSRLFQEVREERGLAYAIYSYHVSHADSGLFTIYAGAAPKQTKEVLDVTMDVLNKIKVSGISESELRRGKEQMKGSLILGLESSNSRMNRMGKNELMLGQHRSLEDTIARIEAINLEEVHDLIAQLFTQPFALSLIGHSDDVINKFRRDQLVEG